MWIQNVSLDDIRKGRHLLDDSMMLIQIVDPDMKFPESKHTFKEVRQYKFLDLEFEDKAGQELKISDSQAKNIIRDLDYAIRNDINVVVHCHMGVCRSGAVAEVGIMMGFKDTKAFRIPNLMVKHKLMKILGYTYD